MRYSEEKTPILQSNGSNNKPGSRWPYNGHAPDERTSLNAASDDFADLHPAGGNVDHSRIRALFDPYVIGMSLLFLLLSIGCTVGMPVYLAGLVTHRSDPFALAFLLPTCGMLLTLFITLAMRRAVRGTWREISLYPFFLKSAAVYGLLTTLGFILQAFCGVPSRTPAYIQATAVVAAIPAALLTKYAIYRKGYTLRQTLCIIAIVLSLVLVMLNLLATPNYIPGAAPKDNHVQPVENFLLSDTQFANETGPPSTTTSTTTSTTPSPTSILSTTPTRSTKGGGSTTVEDGQPTPSTPINNSTTSRSVATNATITVTVNTTSSFDNTTATPSTPPTTLGPNPLEEEPSTMARVLWSLGFTLGCAFHGVAIVIMDEPVRLKGGHPMVVCLYGHTMTFLWMVFMFFFDLIPTFGWATTLADFRGHLHHGVKCLVGADTDCAVIAWRGWLEILIYTAYTITQCYLLDVANCPVYLILITACAVPYAGLVWSCIADTGFELLWFPSATPLSAVLVLAILVSIPATYIYRHLCQSEQKERFEEL